MRTFYGQGRGGQFFASVFYAQLLMKLYTAKMFFGEEYHFKMTSNGGQAGLHFSEQTKEQRT